jgi:hypothetical protein
MHVRSLLLILLALLLPLRTALAAAQPCAGAWQAAAMVAAAPAAQPAAGDDVTHHGCHGHDDPSGLASTDTPDAGCHACAGTCCLTPLATAPPQVGGQAQVQRACYPALAVPGASFQSGGPDRPPRRC